MQWRTLYIKGRSGFKPVVLVKLKAIILHGSSQPDQNVLMVWMDGAKPLRSLKLVIGAEIIFRYRLFFFTDLNEHLATKAIQEAVPLSSREREMLHEIREASRRVRKNIEA